MLRRGELKSGMPSHPSWVPDDSERREALTLRTPGHPSQGPESRVRSVLPKKTRRIADGSVRGGSFSSTLDEDMRRVETSGELKSPAWERRRSHVLMSSCTWLALVAWGLLKLPPSQAGVWLWWCTLPRVCRCSRNAGFLCIWSCHRAGGDRDPGSCGKDAEARPRGCSSGDWVDDGHHQVQGADCQAGGPAG